MENPLIAIVTTVWGHDYVDFYKNHVLPYTRSVLPEGFLIVCATTSEHVSELSNVVDAVFDCGVYSGQNKYDFVWALDRHVMRILHEKGVRRFVYQNPDVIISEQAFLRMRSTPSSVMTLPGIRIWKDLFLTIYKAFDDEILENALTVLHPITLSLARRGGYRRFSRGWPQCVYDITPESIRCQALHRHPLMFDVPDGYDWDSCPAGTVDYQFLGSLGHPWSAYDNLTSSDQGYVLEFSGTVPTIIYSHPPEPDVDVDAAIAAFARSSACDDLHRWFLETEYEWRPRSTVTRAPGDG